MRLHQSLSNTDAKAPEIAFFDITYGIVIMSYLFFAGGRRLSTRCKYRRPREVRDGKHNTVHKLHEGRCTRKGYLQHYSSWRSQQLHA